MKKSENSGLKFNIQKMKIMVSGPITSWQTDRETTEMAGDFIFGEGEVAQPCPTLCDPWTVAHQSSLSMGFSRQEYWSGLPFPSPGELPDPGIEPGSPALQADALPSEPPGKP